MKKRSNYLTPPDSLSYSLNKEFPIEYVQMNMIDVAIKQLHFHNVMEFGLCHEGEGTFIIEDKVFPFKAGDLFVIHPLEMHRACASTKNGAIWSFIMANPAVLLQGRVRDSLLINTNYFAGNHFCNRFTDKEHPKMNRIAHELILECKNIKRFYEDRISLLLTDLLIELNRQLPAQVRTESTRDEADLKRLEPAINSISKNYCDSVSMNKLADLCAMSDSHFRRLFVRIFGKSPKQYLSDYRLSLAGHLLGSTKRKVLDIAMECGFQTLSSFNRMFQIKNGCTPTIWRTEYRT